MILVFCVDNRDGVAFNHRRLSRDSAIVNDVNGMAKDSRIVISEYSKKQFPDGVVTDDYKDGDYVFSEIVSVKKLAGKAKKAVVYCFNRDYPSDTKSDFPYGEYKKISAEDFVGTSHGKITKTVYEK